MKITGTILSIPPYLSTTWKNISSLHVREEKGNFILIVLLQNRVQIEVPNLDKETIDAVFEAHARAAEEEAPHKCPTEGPFSLSLPLRPNGPIGTLGSGMEHNPEQANAPTIPPEVLNKIATIARAFGLDDTSALPKAEQGCNCVYCQVARTLQLGTEIDDDNEEPLEQAEEIISEEDLKFRNWEVKQTSEKLYSVVNPLDQNENYNVFLGTPLGCTCGMKNCEHIRAVLNS